MQTQASIDLSRCRVLSGFALKRIAVVSMVIDHVDGVLIRAALAPYWENGTLFVGPGVPAHIRTLLMLRPVFQALGSIAFPIFCFLIVEGFLHTREARRYAGRLLLFALLSEIPFDLAHYAEWMNFSLQNVLFTLFCGTLTLMGLRFVSEKYAASRRAVIALSLLCVFGGMGLAFLLRGEYVFLGVASITLLYVLRSRPLLSVLAGLAPLLVASPYALLSLPALLCYNGKRGTGSQAFFYWFYPAHFLLLYGVAQLIISRGG